MIWSFSASRVFRSCQRQWYFRYCIANANAKKEPLRREAYLLSKLQSVQAWRGQLVDLIISERIVAALNHGWSMSPVGIVAEAQALFDKQLDFAMKHGLRTSDLTPTKAGDAFAAFHAVEYGLGVSDKDISQAWVDVEKALANLFSMCELIGLLRKADRRIAQRALMFSHNQVSVRAVPDLIALFSRRLPVIIDWKVHTFGTEDYRLQLAHYAVALARCKPHKDFAVLLSSCRPTDIQLLEVQLLTNQLREYRLSESDIEEVDSYIYASCAEMALAIGGEMPKSLLDPFDFPPANYPDTCQRCAFRSPCWERAI